MAGLEFRKALAELRAIWSLGNTYFDRSEPWVAIKVEREDAELTTRTCVNLIALFARLSAPVMPFISEQVLDALGVPETERGWPERFDPDALPAGHRFEVPPVLFRKVSDEDVEQWRERFGGEAEVAGVGEQS